MLSPLNKILNLHVDCPGKAYFRVPPGGAASGTVSFIIKNFLAKSLLFNIIFVVVDFFESSSILRKRPDEQPSEISISTTYF
jgi:hypothetical protein